MREGAESWFCSRVLLPVYRRVGSETLRSRLRRLIVEQEGGPALSLTIRKIFAEFFRLDVGLYTAGPCRMKPNVFHPGTTIGRYCSIADTVRTYTRNHPMNILSTHAFFYNPALGQVKGDPIRFDSLSIGHGVWMGHNVTVLHPTQQIGDGAVICPGSVVYSNVPPYAIVSGFPARVVGYRFGKETIAKLLASKWWERRPEELANDVKVIERYVERAAATGTSLNSETVRRTDGTAEQLVARN